MLTLAIAGPSWAHRLGAGPKLGVLFLAMLATLKLTQPVPLLFALACVMGLYASLGKRAIAPALAGLRPLLWIAALVIAFHAVMAEPVNGFAMAIRIFVMVGLANFVTMTTPTGELIDTVTRLAGPFRRVGLHPRSLGLAIALFLRYIPVLRARAETLRLAWRARSQRRPGVRIILPLVLTTLDDADQLSDALRARGGARSPEQYGKNLDDH